MNAFVWVLTLVISLSHTLFLQADCHCDVVELEEKIYLNGDQILISDNKIAINIDEVTYETPAVFTDERGYYIEKIGKKRECSWYEWKCTGCSKCNAKTNWKCKKCGTPVWK